MVFSAAFIIVIEFCERVGYYTFQSTQKSWLQNQGYSNAGSSSMNQIFGLLSYISCFFGGWLAETPFGRYWTIMVLVVVYVVGCFLAAIATHANIESVPLYLVGTFVLIALGTGGIKPNVCTFGADQIDPKDPRVEQKKESFFMYFYLTINVGCVIAFGFLANVATNGVPPYVSAEDGYFFAYMVAAGFMALAFLIYILGTRFYREDSFRTNSESVLRLCVDRLLSGRGHILGKVALMGWGLLPVLIVVSITQAFIPSFALTQASLVLDIICIACLCVAHRDNSWLGTADAVTRGLDVVPVLLIGNLVFNVLYNTMASVFYSQACQMDTRLGSGEHAFKLSGAFFNLADAVAIIVFTPVIERLLIPTAERLLKRPVSFNMKVYVGVAFAMGSQLVAALLEYARRSAAVLPVGSECAPLINGEHVRMSGISAFWMSIPYAMIGIGEVLVNPVLQHVAYEGADPSMRSLVQAFNLFAMGGMPNAVSAAMSQATASFVPNDLNDGNLPAVYFINVAFGILGCGVYYLVSASRPSHQKDVAKSKASPGADSEEAQAERPPVLLGSHHVNGDRSEMKREDRIVSASPADATLG